MRYSGLILILIIVAILLMPVFVSASHGGLLSVPEHLVPDCPDKVVGDKTIKDVCEVCDIFRLVQNILNFIWFGLVAPLAVLFLAWGGFLMLTSPASPSGLEKGRKILRNTFVGIIIIFFAWFGVDAIIKILVNPDLLGSDKPAKLFGGKFGPWNRIECRRAPASEPSGDSSGGDSSTNDLSAGDPTFGLSEQVRKGRVFLSSNASCTDDLGNPVSAETTFSELSSRKPLTVCSSGCNLTSNSCKRRSDITLNQNMLQALNDLALQSSYTITSLTTGSHSQNSLHYRGDAVDLVPRARSLQGFENIFKFFKDPVNREKYGVKKVLCETKTGKKSSDGCRALTSPKSWQRDLSHIHVEF